MGSFWEEVKDAFGENDFRHIKTQKDLQRELVDSIIKTRRNAQIAKKKDERIYNEGAGDMACGLYLSLYGAKAMTELMAQIEASEEDGNE